jgi:beta-xylosidase
MLLSACLSGAVAQQRGGRGSYQNPAIAGDYPDPSIIRVGADYWAAATSSEWAPEFPILHSRDLVNWEVAGAVFQKRPDWSNGNYWAPEISEYRGRYYVYYVGHKKQDGPLCVAVATAARPIGPYKDHGPIICQEDGSIDPVPVTDERGDRYLVWKEDGNSRNQPTPIWAQKLSQDGTKLTGERKELIRNDAAWEAQLVEGPFVQRRGGWFYLFYSGNACCGRECNYALGVARSRKLLGPWEKNPGNPILRGNEGWKCPGHGSIVADPLFMSGARRCSTR